MARRVRYAARLVVGLVVATAAGAALGGITLAAVARGHAAWLGSAGARRSSAAGRSPRRTGSRPRAGGVIGLTLGIGRGLARVLADVRPALQAESARARRRAGPRRRAASPRPSCASAGSTSPTRPSRAASARPPAGRRPGRALVRARLRHGMVDDFLAGCEREGVTSVGPSEIGRWVAAQGPTYLLAPVYAQLWVLRVVASLLMVAAAVAPWLDDARALRVRRATCARAKRTHAVGERRRRDPQPGALARRDHRERAGADVRRLGAARRRRRLDRRHGRGRRVVRRRAHAPSPGRARRARRGTEPRPRRRGRRARRLPRRRRHVAPGEARAPGGGARRGARGGRVLRRRALRRRGRPAAPHPQARRGRPRASSSRASCAATSSSSPRWSSAAAASTTSAASMRPSPSTAARIGTSGSGSRGAGGSSRWTRSWSAIASTTGTRVPSR